MNELTHVDLFSGIGGFALAAQWAGFKTVCFSEIEPYPSAVLRKHWPGVPNLGDIRTADFAPYAGSTLLTGGFPCQPFSASGKRRGRQDDRYLWPSMLQAIRTVRPTWVVGENVTGIVQMELDNVCADLEAEGYEVQPLIIPACAVKAKHRRDRVWIVANLDVKRSQASWQCGEAEIPAKGIVMEPTITPFIGYEAHAGLLRSVYGVSRRVDRIKSLGNAIVPQVAYEILRVISDIETQHE